MKKQWFALITLLLSFSSIASSDIVLDGERWEAASTGYTCGAYTDTNLGPVSHRDMDVQFETITTDYTLDNGLIKATFIENGLECRYSALMFADNKAATIELVRSNAYAVETGEECSEGKEILDQQLAFNSYQYWGHPHHLTILIEDETASELCGEDKTKIGIDFIVSRFLGER